MIYHDIVAAVFLGSFSTRDWSNQKGLQYVKHGNMLYKWHWTRELLHVNRPPEGDCQGQVPEMTVGSFL